MGKSQTPKRRRANKRHDQGGLPWRGLQTHHRCRKGSQQGRQTKNRPNEGGEATTGIFRADRAGSGLSEGNRRVPLPNREQTPTGGGVRKTRVFSSHRSRRGEGRSRAVRVMGTQGAGFSFRQRGGEAALRKEQTASETSEMEDLTVSTVRSVLCASVPCLFCERLCCQAATSMKFWDCSIGMLKQITRQLIC